MFLVGQVIYAPVVATELRKQAVEWYEHLPPPIRFPLNGAPLFDLRKSFLRVQFTALNAVILWPSVLQWLEHSMNESIEQVDQLSEQLGHAKRETRDCIEYCVLCSEIAQELLMNRHLGLQFSIWA